MSKPGRAVKAVIVALLVVSAVTVVMAARAMPEGYSWRAHSISESAAQGLRSAWIARLGFLCFGFAVAALALTARGQWGRAAFGMHLAFAVCMFGTATFSHRPWFNDVPFDPFEDFLHSVTATAMGFAFSLGVLARFFARGPGDAGRQVLDVVALALAAAMPFLAEAGPSYAGLVQRVMFATGYLWYGAEAMLLSSAGPCNDPKA